MDLDNLKKLGSLIINQNILVFWGNKNFDPTKNMPHNLESHFVNQVHGTICVESSSNTVRADAHWSTERHKALLIKTADCLPIFLSINKGALICAIHAGWRGLKDGIISSTISNLSKKIHINSIDVWIGPHINLSSFEVGIDVFNEIKKSPHFRSDFFVSDSKKYFISLKDLARAEFISLGIKNENIIISDIDTKSDDNFYSHRRDRTLGRNYSFIVRL